MNARARSSDCKPGVYAAAAQEIQNMNGAFINGKMKVVPVKANFDEEVRKRLWRMYEELTAR